MVKGGSGRDGGGGWWWWGAGGSQNRVPIGKTHKIQNGVGETAAATRREQEMAVSERRSLFLEPVVLEVGEKGSGGGGGGGGFTFAFTSLLRAYPVKVSDVSPTGSMQPNRNRPIPGGQRPPSGPSSVIIYHREKNSMEAWSDRKWEEPRYCGGFVCLWVHHVIPPPPTTPLLHLPQENNFRKALSETGSNAK